jgi:Yeast PIR protein repeat
LSGDFFNLYSDKQGDQCNEIYIEAINAGGSSGAPAATQASDGQPAATGAAVSVMSDGQPNAVTQISDGQPQA